MALTREELIAAIEEAIGALRTVYTDAAREADLYEAALLAVATEAAEAAGGDCLITNDGVSLASSAVFRTQPGNLYAGNFTYVLASFSGGRQVEIHLGVYVAGKSGVLHECDVAVLDQEEAERSRVGSVHPRSRNLVAAVEAKHYSASPRLRVGREFIGLASEMGPGKCTLAFPAPGGSNIMPLLAKHPGECFDELVPGTPPADLMRGHITQKSRTGSIARRTANHRSAGQPQEAPNARQVRHRRRRSRNAGGGVPRQGNQLAVVARRRTAPGTGTAPVYPPKTPAKRRLSVTDVDKS